MWEYCGMSRNAQGLELAAGRIRELREEFWSNVDVLGSDEELNQALEHAGRVADFFELAELMCLDALHREGILRRAFPRGVSDAGGEAQRDDEHYSYVAAWEFQGVGQPPALHKEPLAFEYVHPSQRSYK